MLVHSYNTIYFPFHSVHKCLLYLFNIYILLFTLSYPFTSVYMYMFYIMLFFLAYGIFIYYWEHYCIITLFVWLLVLLPFVMLLMIIFIHLNFNYIVLGVLMFYLFIICGGMKWVLLHLGWTSLY